jgi:hypothetical protein
VSPELLTIHELFSVWFCHASVSYCGYCSLSLSVCDLLCETAAIPKTSRFKHGLSVQRSAQLDFTEKQGSKRNRSDRISASAKILEVGEAYRTLFFLVSRCLILQSSDVCEISEFCQAHRLTEETDSRSDARFVASIRLFIDRLVWPSDDIDQKSKNSRDFPSLPARE